MRTLHCLISLLLHFWTFEVNGEPITSTNGMCVVVNVMSNYLYSYSHFQPYANWSHPQSMPYTSYRQMHACVAKPSGKSDYGALSLALLFEPLKCMTTHSQLHIGME